MNHLRFALALTVVFTVLVFAACGAENAVAPAVEKTSDMRECRGFEKLMPNFLKVISDGKTENLKRLVETQLQGPTAHSSLRSGGHGRGVLFAERQLPTDRWARCGDRVHGVREHP